MSARNNRLKISKGSTPTQIMEDVNRLLTMNGSTLRFVRKAVIHKFHTYIYELEYTFPTNEAQKETP